MKGVFRMSNISECDKSRNVGYAYVPWQRMEKVYPPNKALCAGTIFPELNLTIDEYERGLWNGK